MFEIRITSDYERWFDRLRDNQAKILITKRLKRLAEEGHTGDAASVGGGVTELRIHHGPGYRLYTTKRDNRIIVLLCGGDKSSQQRDIEKAINLAKVTEVSLL